MPLTDLTLPELVDFRPDITEPEAFDRFWQVTIAEARQLPQEPVSVPAPGPVNQLLVEDFTFSGFDGDPIRAWIVRPRSAERLPAVV